VTTDPGVMLLLALDDCERVAAECERRGSKSAAAGARIVAGFIMERFERFVAEQTFEQPDPQWAEYYANGGKAPSDMIPVRLRGRR
jgi:ribosomal protein S12 methylthiotransferase accessory factor YcaO